MLKKILILLVLLSVNFLASDRKFNSNIELLFGNTESLILKKNYHNLIKNNVTIIPSFFVSKNSFEASASLNMSEDMFIFDELFFKYSFNRFDLIIGRFFANSASTSNYFSSGSMIESGNTIPIPKIGVKYENNFYDIKYTFEMYHGLMKTTKYIDEAPYLHDKKLYLIKDFNKNLFSVGLGIHHTAIWGGSTIRNGKQPSSFKDFLDVFLGDKSREGVGTIGDQTNALGDARGMWDFYIHKNGYNNSLKFYYQNFFEDKSGLKLKDRASQFDGLFGIEIASNQFSFIYEYLKTTYQGGNFHPPGIDSYYYSGAYYPGWQYNNYSIGNMYISPLNNRAKIHHLHYSKKINKNKIYFDLSFGNYFRPFNEKDYNQSIDLSMDKGAYFHQETLGFERLINKNLSVVAWVENTQALTNIVFSLNYKLNN